MVLVKLVVMFRQVEIVRGMTTVPLYVKRQKIIEKIFLSSNLFYKNRI